jgi:LAO/AO transport system kinase
VVIVETVGVGQSEIAVHGMTDMFCVLQLPNAGDDLQAIKKGVMELADLVVINKADIDPCRHACQAQITSSLRLLGMHGNPITPTPARCGSRGAADQCLAGAGGGGLLGCSQQLQELQTANGRLALRREKQALAWMWERIDFGLKQAFRQHPQVRLLPVLQDDVARSHRRQYGSKKSASSPNAVGASSSYYHSIAASPLRDKQPKSR